MSLRLTLLSDGSSDRALLPILRWLLIARHRLAADVEPQWADLRSLVPAPHPLHERIAATLKYYPSDVLFVHRDAEGEAPEHRAAEIDKALRTTRSNGVPVIKVIPVRMSEAWLLVSTAAIRRAAGNPNGSMELDMPSISEIESITDPKAILYQLLEDASGLGPRRRRRLRPEQRAHRVAELVDDFSPLLELPAFRRLDEQVRSCLDELKHRSASG